MSMEAKVKDISWFPVAVSKPALKKIGIFLPALYFGGSLNGAKNIAKMLYKGSRYFNEPVEIIFSCLEGFYNISEEFSDLLELGINIRETSWETVTREQVQFSQKLIQNESSLASTHYIAPVDGINNFQDCDFWFLISDRFSFPLAPLKPYGLMIYDYIQRYAPQIFPKNFVDQPYLDTARYAKFILTTTPATREDAIQYAGISPERVHLAPMEFNPFLNESSNECFQKLKYDYFIWTSNSTPHKNHKHAIEALEIYYQELQGSLKVLMTGALTETFLPNKDLGFFYPKEICELIEKRHACKENLKIVGNLSNNKYVSTLKHAKFLWHPTLIDNGTYSVIEAAYYGVAALSHDYPQMRFINERFNLNLNFCDATQPRAMAIKLKEMEQKGSLTAQLPSRDFLNTFTYSNISNEYWQLFRKLI